MATLIILLCDVSISSKGRLDDHEDHTGSYSDLFNSIDKNHNGNVSPEEIEEVFTFVYTTETMLSNTNCLNMQTISLLFKMAGYLWIMS